MYLRTCDRDERGKDAVGDVHDFDLAPVEDVAEGESDEAAPEGAVHRGDGGLGSKIPFVIGHAKRARESRDNAI